MYCQKIVHNGSSMKGWPMSEYIVVHSCKKNEKWENIVLYEEKVNLYALTFMHASISIHNLDLSLTLINWFCSGLLLAGCLATCTIIELFSMWNLTKVEIHLCNMLSPEGPRVSLGSYNWGLVSICIFFCICTKCQMMKTFNSALPFKSSIFVVF